MNNIFINKLKTTATTKVLSWSIMLAFVLLGYSTSQAQCSGISLACNDGLFASMNENCIFQLTPDVVLENQQFPDSDYTIVAYDENGNQIGSGSLVILSSVYLNQDIEVSITYNPCTLTCWGGLTLQDKFAPQVNNCNNITIDCNQSTSPFSTGFPNVTENCGSVTYDYADIIESLPCADPLGSRITRSWIITDNSGNTTNCTQVISVRKGDLADVVFPADRNYSCATPPALLPNGAPNPAATGEPTNTACGNIQKYYTDVEFELCGAGYKVLRTWVVIDWCTGAERTENHIIKVEDTAAPIATCPTDSVIPGSDPNNPVYGTVVSADSHQCGTNWSVLAPTVIYDCSSITWTVSWLGADGNGQPDPSGVYVPANGSYPNFNIDLPMGPTWLRYTITDECGHSTDCFTEVYVQDDTAPSPVCEGFTTVALNSFDCVEVFASTFDDHSWDNCGVTDFEVSRDGQPFGESVEFCCTDPANNPISVTLRVFDAAGNHNDCIVQVNVTDQVMPTFTYCPADITVSCNMDLSDHSLTGGDATASDNCGVTVVPADNGNLSSCNMGVITRNWIATDVSGNTALCTQRITLSNTTPLSLGNITWPVADLNLNTCNTVNNIDPDVINSKPVINSSSQCIEAGMSFSDQEFYGIPGVCVQVIRTWRVTDWCDDSQPRQYFNFTQNINLSGGDAPTFTNCTNITQTTGVSNCQAFVPVNIIATDDCTASTALQYVYTVDLHSDGSVDRTGLNNSASDNYPSGVHTINFSATDECGNEETCSFTVTVPADNLPIPICLSTVVVPLDANGNASIWAEDFDHKSEDGCGGNGQLAYSFNASGSQPNRTFSCNDIDNGIAQSIPLEMHISSDNWVNSEFCAVTLILQDNNNNSCVDQSNASARIAGKVMSADLDEAIEVEVELMELTSNTMAMEMTGAEGTYEFSNVAFYNGYEISPYKTTEPMNGVSTLDLVLIQKHILGLRELDSPYELIAADINNNQVVSATDLIALRKLILGISTQFPNNDPYRFVVEGYDFVDPSHPWGYQESININELYIDQTDANFTAIKIGDINKSATYNVGSLNVSDRSDETLELSIADQSFKAGQLEEIVINAASFNGMVGMQLAINFDPSILELTGINAHNMPLNLSNYNLQRADEGIVSISWDEVYGLSLEDNAGLFALQFKTKADGILSQVLSMNTETTQAEAYNTELETMDISLEFRNEISDEEDLSLFQNNPNPFTNETTISFHLIAQTTVSLDIYDVNGALVKSININGDKGINQTTIYAKDLPSAGIYYTQLVVGKDVRTSKMVLIH